MKNKKFRPDGLKLAAFSYLYIPVVIFFLTWMKWYIALPACFAIIYPMARLFCGGKIEGAIGSAEVKPDISDAKTPVNIGDKRGRLYWALVFLVFILCLCWCCLSGIGGFVLQSGDFPKHNVILKDLINCSWPVRYQMRGREGVLSYYIGGYIIPALFGKAAGGSFDRAQDALLVWMTLGVFISVLLIYRCIERRLEGSKTKEFALVAVFFALFSFAPFICPLSGIFAKWYPWEVGDGVHWLSNMIYIQYSSNMTLLSYVFPQMVPGLVSVSLLKSMRREYDKWGLILAPLALYSAFVFLGMAMLMLTIFGVDAIFSKGACLKRGNILSVYNICSAFTALCLVFNFLGVILQEKPESTAMGLGLIDYTGYVHTLVFFEAAWLLWALILSRPKSVLILAASINLFLYPFFRMGYYNDLCMRASIPALLILCVEVAERLVVSFNRDRWYSLLIAACLVITAAGPLQELDYCYTGKSTESRNYFEMYESSEDFFFSYDFIEYQYVDWNPEGISGFVFR